MADTYTYSGTPVTDPLILDKIVESDTIQSMVEKCNSNFEKIVKHGGGPQGIQGVAGKDGATGRRGNSIQLWTEDGSDSDSDPDLSGFDPADYLVGDVVLCNGIMYKILSKTITEDGVEKKVNYINEKDGQSLRGKQGEKGDKGDDAKDILEWLSTTGANSDGNQSGYVYFQDNVNGFYLFNKSDLVLGSIKTPETSSYSINFAKKNDGFGFFNTEGVKNACIATDDTDNENQILKIATEGDRNLSLYSENKINIGNQTLKNSSGNKVNCTTQEIGMSASILSLLNETGTGIVINSSGITFTGDISDLETSNSIKTKDIFASGICDVNELKVNDDVNILFDSSSNESVIKAPTVKATTLSTDILRPYSQTNSENQYGFLNIGGNKIIIGSTDESDVKTTKNVDITGNAVNITSDLFMVEPMSISSETIIGGGTVNIGNSYTGTNSGKSTNYTNIFGVQGIFLNTDDYILINAKSICVNCSFNSEIKGRVNSYDDIYVGVPIGTIMMYPTQSAVPMHWVECFKSENTLINKLNNTNTRTHYYFGVLATTSQSEYNSICVTSNYISFIRTGVAKVCRGTTYYETYYHKVNISGLSKEMRNLAIELFDKVTITDTDLQPYISKVGTSYYLHTPYISSVPNGMKYIMKVE